MIPRSNARRTIARPTSRGRSSCRSCARGRARSPAAAARCGRCGGSSSARSGRWPGVYGHAAVSAVVTSALSSARSRAWPTASSRPSSSGASPRIASLTFSSSSRYEFAGARPRSCSTLVGSRRSSIPGDVDVPGSRRRRGFPRRRPPRARPDAGSDEAAVEVREDAAREAKRPGKETSTPLLPDDLLGVHALRLAGEETERVDAVAADVHQRAAVELGVEAGVVRAVNGCELEAEGGADDPQPSDGAVRRRARRASRSAGGAAT